VKARDNNISIVNRDCKIEGILHFRGHLIVEGIIEGTLLAETVFTEKNSNVKAQISAISLTIAGYFEGDIEVTGTLTLLKTADVRGHIKCHNLVIDEGGIINGSVKFISAENPQIGPT
jgi:Integral membrane protein CcmA involved in cell shape determination